MQITNDHFLRRYTPLLLIVAGLILKALFISSNSLGGDEPFSVYHSQMSVSAIIHHLSFLNNPPLYEIMLHFWIKLFGISELSVRVPSLVFSVITVWFIYRIGIEFFNFRIALLAGLLYTFTDYHLAFSHEARVYPLFALLTAISMYYFLIISNRRDAAFKYYFLLLIINSVLLYSHYFGAFVMIIQTLSFLFFKEIRSKITVKNYCIYLFILGILYIPNMSVLLKRFLESSSHGTWVNPPDGIASLYDMLWDYSNKPLTTVVSMVILAAALVKLILKKDIKNIPVSNKIVSLWFLFPLLFMFGISYWIPMFLDRYLIFVSLAYYLLLAICAVYIINEGKFYAAIPVLLAIFFVATFNPNVDNRRHVRETVDKIKSLKDDHTKMLICPREFIPGFVYYYNRQLFQDVDEINVYGKMIVKLKNENIYVINNINEVILDNDDRIIYLDAAANFSFPGNNIIPSLDKAYERKSIYKFYQIFNIYEYVKK